jgi:shikimate kinase
MMDTFRSSRIASAPDPARPHLVLVGLPGSGKTTVGRLVAEALGRTFLDLDAEIERREGATIAALFAEKGEPWFRARERALTGEVRALGNMVLAPGGGWIADPGNVAMLRPPARIIYLKVRPETALRRMGADTAARPLLGGSDPLGALRGLLARRAAAYRVADIVIDTEQMTARAVADDIVKLASRFSLS